MKCCSVIVFFLIFGFAQGWAQIRRYVSGIEEVKKKEFNEAVRLNIDQSRHGFSKEVRKKTKPALFVLYRQIIRRYTWFEGCGEPITQEVANHLPVYYKLSIKNKAGHWQHIEALQGGHPSANHGQNTYVLDTRYDVNEVNRDWAKRLKKVTQWVQIPGLDGKEVVEERAYDAERNLVYSFLPVKNEDGRIVGTYSDAWGLPADMWEDSTSYYGSVVCITYDSCGRDSIVDFLDGKGMRKYNANGVDQQQWIYDDKDRLVMTTSHNLVGDYTVDNWGNCGNRYVYDDINHKYSVIRLDKDLKPMRMPDFRADETKTFIRCDVTMDRWGRDSVAVMLDEKGKNDTTSNGIHKILYRYAENGILSDTEYFDLEGKMIRKKQRNN